MMTDIEENERRERNALMSRAELPTPDPDVAAALRRAGIDLGDIVPGAPLVSAHLPIHWSKDPAAEHRTFYLVDPNGVRRFRVFWKAGILFGADPGRGGVVEIEQRDAFARRWSADDSFEVLCHRRRYFEISCAKCQHRSRGEMDAGGERYPGEAARLEEMIERVFAREHGAVCP